MPVTDSFMVFVLEQLEPLGPIASRRMFGGVGLYAGDLFFALIFGDVLYLKADEATRDARIKKGALPFRPYPNRPKSKDSRHYLSVPASILEDPEALLMWARESVTIAGRRRRN